MGENTSENCVVGEAAVGEHHHATQSGLGEELEGDGGEVSEVVDSDEELDYGSLATHGGDRRIFRRSRQRLGLKP